MKTELKELEKMAEELSEKNSWVRKSAYELMGQWSAASECGEKIYAKTDISLFLDGDIFYLCTGEEEVKNNDDDDFDHQNHFVDMLDIADLRAFLFSFPEYVRVIVKKMSTNIDKNKELEIFLKKML